MFGKYLLKEPVEVLVTADYLEKSIESLLFFVFVNLKSIKIRQTEQLKALRTCEMHTRFATVLTGPHSAEQRLHSSNLVLGSQSTKESVILL